MITPTGPFPREARIRRSREFQALSQRARRSAAEAFVVLVATPPSPSGRARLGVTVSRRVGCAVVRNRVKRRIREWFRRDGGSIAAGMDVVVIARPAAAHLPGSETFAELSRLCRSAAR